MVDFNISHVYLTDLGYDHGFLTTFIYNANLLSFAFIYRFPVP